MKKFCVLFLSCLICLNAVATPAVVKKIIDGDTFIAKVTLADGIEVMSISVRLKNVDTPELHGKCESEIKRAQYAKQRLGELIPVGSQVEIKNIRNDKYPGRIDANVFDSANRDVGLVLVQENVGRPYGGEKRKSWCD
ncbi:MAG: thermonuclease family protein [Alphaproteobacteria bacterium]|nr:thermonuclease family protein [Alphaproteobacteria bacterium]